MKRLIPFCMVAVLAAGCAGGGNQGEQQGDNGTDNSDTQAAQQLDFAAFFKQSFLDRQITALDATLENLVHPKVGLFLIFRAGGIVNIKQLKPKSIQDIRLHFPASEVLAGQVCKLEHGAMPTYDCTNGFAKEGCFYDDFEKQKYITEQRDLAVTSYLIEPDEITEMAAANADQMISQKIVITKTDPALSLYFGQKDQKWYLVGMDAASYNCH